MEDGYNRIIVFFVVRFHIDKMKSLTGHIIEPLHILLNYSYKDLEHWNHLSIYIIQFGTDHTVLQLKDVTIPPLIYMYHIYLYEL